MKGISTLRAAVFTLALVALAAGAAGALAQTKFPTRVTLDFERVAEDDTISGKVKSKAHACERKRKVRLHHRPVSELEPSSIVATLRTNGKGKWTFKPEKNKNGDHYATPGYYRVKVGEVKLRGDDGGITCKEKNSSPLYIG